MLNFDIMNFDVLHISQIVMVVCTAINVFAIKRICD